MSAVSRCPSEVLKDMGLQLFKLREHTAGNPQAIVCLSFLEALLEEASLLVLDLDAASRAPPLPSPLAAQSIVPALAPVAVVAPSCVASAPPPPAQPDSSVGAKATLPLPLSLAVADAARVKAAAAPPSEAAPTAAPPPLQPAAPAPALPERAEPARQQWQNEGGREAAAPAAAAASSSSSAPAPAFPPWLEQRAQRLNAAAPPFDSSAAFPALAGGAAPPAYAPAARAPPLPGRWADAAATPAQPQPRPHAAYPRPMGRGFAGALVAPRDEAEAQRVRQLSRRADYECLERVNGRQVNVMQGLELHQNFLSSEEQARLLHFILEEQLPRGQRNLLPGRTFSAPAKWMKGKGRITIQYGVCYSYAPTPGITQDVVEAMPATLEAVVDRMVRWGVLPAAVRPDSCIVNIYEEGDCIPPHIDHHDFTRPFCTLSLLSEAPIVFGTRLTVVSEGVFTGAFALPLPTGSVCVINGASADVAKHAIPGVPSKRVSITFRRVSDPKRPLARTVPFRGEQPDVLQDGYSAPQQESVEQAVVPPLPPPPPPASAEFFPELSSAQPRRTVAAAWRGGRGAGGATAGRGTGNSNRAVLDAVAAAMRPLERRHAENLF